MAFRLARRLAAAALIGVVATNGAGRADDAKTLFAGKALRLLVGMPPGGGVDAYARLLQRHISSHLPESPAVVVENAPGAGSLRAVMAAANSPKGDATTIVTFSSSLLLDAVTAPAQTRVDFRDFAFLGNVAEDSRVCFVRADLAIKTMADLLNHAPIAFGATAPGTSGNVDTAILRQLLHAPMREVQGYPGSADKRLALERGEIDGDCAGVTSLPETWLTQGKIAVLVRFSPMPSPLLPADVPFGGDFVEGDAARQLYDFLITPQEFGRLFATPKTTSPARVAALRAAFDATMLDPDFLADAKSMGLLVTPTSGEAVDRRIAGLYHTPPALVAAAKSVTSP